MKKRRVGEATLIAEAAVLKDLLLLGIKYSPEVWIFYRMLSRPVIASSRRRQIVSRLVRMGLVLARLGPKTTRPAHNRDQFRIGIEGMRYLEKVWDRYWPDTEWPGGKFDGTQKQSADEDEAADTGSHTSGGRVSAS